MRGRCFCGAIRFEVDPPVSACVTCHCESCRRQCSAPMTAYLGAPDGQWRWMGKAPRTFASSTGVERSFCGTCGTPMTFRSENMSGVMHFYVAALDDPEAIRASIKEGVERRVKEAME